MKRLIIMSVALTFLLCLSFPAYADRIDRRADEATNIVVGKIKQVKSFYATNKWGDDLIMSEVTLKVDKVHKGDQIEEACVPSRYRVSTIKDGESMNKPKDKGGDIWK